jgi:WD40 repeat protein
VLAQQLTGAPSSLSSSPTEEEPHQHPPHRPHQAIWAMKISKDGKYLAAGGQNCVLRVWETLNEGVPDKQDSIKVFDDKPLREYKGHHADILDISWSKVTRKRRLD